MIGQLQGNGWSAILEDDGRWTSDNECMQIVLDAVYSSDTVSKADGRLGIKLLQDAADRFGLTVNQFCATGDGGGVDATCSPGEAAGTVVGWRERAHADAVLGLQHESNYKFYDAKSKDDKNFVEVKTMLKGKKQAINAHADALLRKVDGMQQFPGATYHTVARDDRDTYEGGNEHFSGHNLYYKRGNGKYALSKMYKVKSDAELKRLMKMKDEDLPEAARGALPSGTAVKKLREDAAKDDVARKERDANRRAKAKAEGRNIYERQT